MEQNKTKIVNVNVNGFTNDTNILEVVSFVPPQKTYIITNAIEYEKYDEKMCKLMSSLTDIRKTTNFKRIFQEFYGYNRNYDDESRLYPVKLLKQIINQIDTYPFGYIHENNHKEEFITNFRYSINHNGWVHTLPKFNYTVMCYINIDNIKYGDEHNTGDNGYDDYFITNHQKRNCSTLPDIDSNYYVYLMGDTIPFYIENYVKHHTYYEY